MISKYRAFLGILAAALAVACIGFWPSSNHGLATGTVAPAAVSAHRAAPAISILEMHNLAHLEFLPVQEVEDQTFVFAQARR
jgi:hypothetical protein